jgi:hypothetical protein
MANIKRRFQTPLVCGIAFSILLPIGTAIAQKGHAEPHDELFMHGTRTTPEISAKCEAFIDRTFGRGTGAEHHRTAGFGACLRRGGD